MAVANEAPVTETPPESAEDKAHISAFEEFAAKKRGSEPKPSEVIDPPSPPEGDNKAAAPAAAEDPAKASQPKPDTQPAPVTPAPADIWANATPEQRAAFEATAAEVKRHKNHAAGEQRTVQTLRRQLTDLTRQVSAMQDQGGPPKGEEATAEAERAATSAAVSAEGKLDFKSPKWSSFKENYPDIASVLEETLQPILADHSTLRRDFDSMSEDRQTDHIDRQETLVAEKHPDWMDVTATKVWADWLTGQPRYVQEAVARNGQFVIDADEVVDVLTRFKRDTISAETKPQTTTQTPAATAAAAAKPAPTNLTTKRKEQLDANLSTTSRGGIASSGPPENDHEANFAYFAAKKRQGLSR